MYMMPARNGFEPEEPDIPCVAVVPDSSDINAHSIQHENCRRGQTKAAHVVPEVLAALLYLLSKGILHPMNALTGADRSITYIYLVMVDGLARTTACRAADITG